MMKTKIIIFFLFFILSFPLISAEYWDFLTIGQGDRRYCRTLGNCEISNLIVQNLSVVGGFFNVSVINYNVTGNIDIKGNITGIDSIRFRLGAIIDNLVDGLIRLTGNLNVNGTVQGVTQTEFDTLTDNSIADTLHRHSELVASDGSPDPALSVDAVGNVGIGTATPTSKLHVIGNINATKNITAENVFLPQYIFSHTNVTITLNGASLWTNVSFDQEVTKIKQGIGHTATDGTNTTFTINVDGIYDISFNFDVIDTSVGASDVDIGGRLILADGTEINGSMFETDLTKQHIETELSHEFLAEFKAGDKVIFQFIANDEDVEMSTHGTFGDHPDSASVVIKKHANIPK